MSDTDTLFAPADRADSKSIHYDASILSKAGILDHLTHVVPTMMVILNRQRQVVYANQRLKDLLGMQLEDVLGKRPGELLDCIHAHENDAGCGTTEFCRECGAVRAILKAQEETESVGIQEECTITTFSGSAFEFRVWASPYILNGVQYVIFTLLEISNEKRRRVLEHIFFHDVNSLLHVIESSAMFIANASPGDDVNDLLEALQSASEALAMEISSQEMLLRAENDELTPTVERNVDSVQLLDRLCTIFTDDRFGGPAILKGDCCCVSLMTDRALLTRVLYNMIKNAVEAISSSERITVQCVRKDASVVFSVHNPGAMLRSVELQLFNRSFSTKGEGRGLGTYCMKLFGEKYLKGKVWCTSSEEQGTAFYISIPIDYPH